MTEFIRAITLDDIKIRSGGTGRTVEAYAAIFGEPAEIVDADGHYREMNSPAAFNKTISDRGGRFPVIYHHGLTIAGTPSDRGSIPIGVSTEVKVDKRGVLTVSEYHRSELADEVLEAIKSGAVTAQSYGGRFLRSDPQRPPRGGFRASAGGSLRTVTRLEIAMREFGPTPFPAFSGAAIMGVRAQQLLGALLSGHNDLPSPTTGPAADAPPHEAPDDQPEGSDPDTSSEDAARQADEPLPHSSRSIPLSTRVRAARVARGWTPPNG